MRDESDDDSCYRGHNGMGLRDRAAVHTSYQIDPVSSGPGPYPSVTWAWQATAPVGHVV